MVSYPVMRNKHMKDDQETVYRGKALSLKLEQVTYPDGTTGKLEIVRHPGGAAVVAINEMKEICLIRQYRYAAGDWIWEVPAGRIEHKEDPLETAKRELAEEAGIIAETWSSLGFIYPSPGICDERIHLYKAYDLTQKKVSHEDGEYIEIHWLPLEKAINLIIEGKIIDAKTIVALYNFQFFK